MATNVADLVLDRHANEMRGVADVLGRYVALVQKVADGKALSAVPSGEGHRHDVPEVRGRLVQGAGD